MCAPSGRVIFESTSNRTPWAGLNTEDVALIAEANDPLQSLAELDRRTQTTRHAGYFAYDLGRCFEELPSIAPTDSNIPLFAFVPVQEQNHALVADVNRRIPDRTVPSQLLKHEHLRAKLKSTFTQSTYESGVQRCLDYIAAGDVFQINLSQRLEIPTTASAADLFAVMQQHFPAEFAALLDFGTFAFVSNSPELFLRVTKLPNGRRKIVNRPIKGTRPNAPGMAAELLASEKDMAELAMIVDLQRNDLGRICEIGSVVVTEPRTIETHPTVLHGVATVEGILREDVSLIDILRATFPCGSITGCPKIRAMEIIEELEPVRRGAYCGAIGWIGHGEMELSVAIRTMTIQNGIAYVPVGGGIVADSIPADEYAETMTKATAMLAALGIASTG